MESRERFDKIKEYSIRDVEEITDTASVKDFFTLREKLSGIYDDEIPEMVESGMSYYDQNKDRIKLYVLRDADGKIVAGGQVEFQDFPDKKKKAYLMTKFVLEPYRGKGLATILTEKRVESAKERGCDEAYALVFKDNVPALRSITRDGFEIRSTKEIEPRAQGSYYLTKNLLLESKDHGEIDYSKIPVVDSEDSLVGSRILISLSREALIEKALETGFVGKQIIHQKEHPGINEPVMYLERK